tara:strand:- start:949 stop:2403 length:1455 start_codon:yes stop_codon:yes gene_type:complete
LVQYEFNVYIKNLMIAGHGNSALKEWSSAALAEAIDVDEKTIRSYQKDTIPRRDNFVKLTRAFFPSRDAKRHKEILERFERLWHEARISRNKQSEITGRAQVKNYALLDVWGQVMRTKLDDFSVPVLGRSSDEEGGISGFAADELKIKLTDRKFFIPPTNDLLSLIKSGEIDYEINDDGSDFEDAPISQCVPLATEFDIAAAIEKYRRAYSSLLINEFKSPKRHKPYNKKKLGVWSVASHIPSHKEETTAATIELYDTDYFTNWIMSKVLQDMRLMVPHWLHDMSEFPTITAGSSTVHLPHLTPSIGLNCVIISQTDNGGAKICFRRLKSASSNSVQHGKLHVPVNEGLNHEDLDHQTSIVDIDKWWQRMLKEEIGSELNMDRFKFRAVNIFLDHKVQEFGLFGVLTTDYSIEALDGFTSTGRDSDREFRKRFVEVSANEYDVINFMLDQPKSIHSFVTYTPHLIDILIKDRVIERIPVSTFKN